MMKTLSTIASRAWRWVAVTAVISFPALARAQDRFGINYGTGAGLGTRDVRATIAALINIALSILGIVFLVIALMGGVKWMMAAGNEEAVESGKKSIGQAVVGLLVIFVAFAITKFVFSVLEQAT
jgi:hypothetical protein